MDKPRVTPKDFFLWAGAMVSLYVSVFSFITLCFEYINHAYPDPLSYSYDPYSSGMRFAIASLIVLFPLFLVLMRLIRRDIAANHEKKNIWVRRWALFLTVFVAGATVAIDLITLINYFLGGDLTTRFVLKVLIVLLVGGGAFLHFLADVWGYWIVEPKRAQAVGWASAVVVVFAIVAGFFIMGTPGQIRREREDAQRITDLQSIQWDIVNYWQQKGSIPADLASLNDPISNTIVPVDPGTRQPYEYKRVSPLDFELCATFVTVGGSLDNPSVPKSGASQDNWQHDAGHQCFNRSIDPQRYPVNPKTPTPVAAQ